MGAASHIALDVRDLQASTRFYQALLGSPTLVRPDYVRFETSVPPLVVSLVPGPGGTAANHLGFRLDSVEALEGFAERLSAAGISVDREQDVECCYSRQTKLWVFDPDGTPWELYVRTGSAEGAGSTRRKLPMFTPKLRQQRHRLGEPLTETLEETDEWVLEGTLNALLPDFQRQLKIAFESLRPGGRLVLHGLVASVPLAPGFTLPGPAAKVERVPVEAEPALLAVAAGFVAAHLRTLPGRPHFQVGTAELREILIEAFRPAASAETRVPVVYRGPFAEVKDDFGQGYLRGERAWIPLSRREALAKGPLSDQFTFFEAKSDTPEAECC